MLPVQVPLPAHVRASVCASHCGCRQANTRLQAELDSGTASSNEKMAAASAAAAADREQLRVQIESLDVKLKEQVGVRARACHHVRAFWGGRRLARQVLKC